MKLKYADVERQPVLTVYGAHRAKTRDPFVTFDVRTTSKREQTAIEAIKYVLIYEDDGRQVLHIEDSNELPAMRLDTNKLVWLCKGTEITLLDAELRYACPNP